MKKTILSIVWIFLVKALFGQGFNYTYANQQSNLATGIAADGNGQWVVTGYHGNYGAVPYLSGVFEWPGSGGMVDFYDFDLFIDENPFDFYGSVMNVSKAIYHPADSLFYFAVGRADCDVGFQDKLVKFSNDGFLVETYSPLSLPTDTYAGSYVLDGVDEGGVLIGANLGFSSSEVLYEEEGVFWKLMDIAVNETLLGVNAWYDNHFVYLTKSTLGLVNYTVEENGGEVIAELEVQNGQSVEVLDEERLLLLSSMGLEVIDAEYNIVEERPFFEATHLTIDDEYIYVIDNAGIHFINYDLEEQAVVELEEVDDYQILDVSAQNGRIALVGANEVNANEGFYGVEKATSHLFAKSYTITGADFAPITDVAITDVAHAPVVAQIYSYAPNCMSTRVDDIEVTVKNEGSITISELVLAYTRNGCDLEFYFCHPWFSHSWGPIPVNLAPGASTTLSLDPMFVYDIPSSTTFNLCLTAFAAEGTTETDLSNNRLCGGSSVVVGVEEVTESPDFELYPTLCQDRLTITLGQADHRFEKAVIYNLLGQAIQDLTLPSGQNTIPVDVSQLVSGSYYLRLEGQGVSPALAFVKQ